MNGFYTFHIVLLMLLLVGMSVAAVLFYQYELYFCLLFIGLAMIILIIYICYIQQRSTKLILRMIESIRYNDFSLSFSTQQKSQLESNLRSEINEAISNFRKQLSDQQEHSLYYETMLDTVDSSILITNSKGIIQWMNQTAVQELIGHRIHSLEELNVLNKDFSQKLHSLQPGEVKVIRLYKEDFIQEMAATITNYTNRTENLRLISLKNLRSILEENEMEAWQKLIRVLTHEIMNSITPIISLSDTLSERINKKEKDEYENEMIYQGMQTIHRRSKGLLEFVKNYRQLSRISSPILTPVRISDILGDIRKLYPNKGVEYIYKMEDEEQILMWDRSQMEQVLINLLKNATEACEGRPNSKVYITTQYLKDKQIFQLTVTDNGCGVLPEVLDKIFVPFFTTKAKGSGIGLSLCKQIVNNHGGSISVSSETNKGTSFVLKFLCK